ncbi:RNA polymerase sigma factor [Roseovarius sp. 2305UL8-3]|uniref:RNA polymerase sigma factor n=1 Tax=Roseovarius conchicola TaxID=3121636 RepID=UPI003527207A
MTDRFRQDLVALVPKLRRFALSLTGNTADADDLVQSACVKALRNAGQFQEGTRMDSWMYRIIQTLWIDDRRRAKVQGAKVDPEEAGLSDGGKSARLPEDRMMLNMARNAMNNLPDKQRAVLSLVAIEGLSYKDTAEVLDVPLGTVMSRLARAREALLPRLGLTKGSLQ